MIAFARSQPDTPGKLAAHAYSYEHMELAAYELMALAAERAHEDEVVQVARSIAAQEATMAKRLATNFDRAADASLREVRGDELDEQLVKYLADAHAIESQAIELLERSSGMVGELPLGTVFSDHLQETRRHHSEIERRLQAHDSRPSRIKDAVLRVGALNWGGFFAAQPDTPAKLAGFAFAFEHLEIGGYEQLARVALRAQDEETAAAANRIIGEEHAAAGRIREQFASAVEASLEKQGISV